MQIITLKSDHGKFACAEEGGGLEGQVIAGRPAGLMTANRDSAGAWESFSLVPSDEPGLFGLQSCHGFFACCENEGKQGIVVFRSASLGAWEKFKLWIDGEKVSFEAACRPHHFIKVYPDGRVTLEQSYFNDVPVNEPGGYETFVSDPPISSGIGPQNICVGQLRVTNSGYHDDNGPYLPIGIHLGDLFSAFCHGREAEVKDALSAVRDAGYGLVQFWLNLGSLGGDYWAGREIGPDVTEDYWGKFNRFSDLLDSYGIKGVYCVGDYALRGMSHEDFAKDLGRNLAGRKSAALVISGNEAWQTGADSIDTLEGFCEDFKEFCPSVPITTTSPPSEEKADIANWCNGDFYIIHGWRDGEDHDRIRHIFSIPWEGDPPKYCGYQDEPTGPGDEVSVKASHCYHGRDVDASHLFALAAQSLMTNQGYNFFCSDGVKLESVDSLKSWGGFKEVASVVNYIPKDIMSWDNFMHFGSTQQWRVFGPTGGDEVTRFDHRIGPHGEIFGVLYGDKGGQPIECIRACEIKVINYLGEVIQEGRFDSGQRMHIEFVRSENGQPGRTSFLVTGRLI